MEFTRNKNKKQEMIDALNNAQRLAFAPLTFQALAAAVDLGLLKELDKKPAGEIELEKALNKTHYTVNTLLEVLETADVVKKDENLYSLTKTGQLFLYNEMTRVNFNFVKDVCYEGAKELCNSFLSQKPQGLRKHLYKDAETIYPFLSVLPEKMRNSWYEFDHYYSDNCFDLIYKIIFKNQTTPIYDIGANMGAFEKVCLKNNPKADLTMIDLPENIDFIKSDKELSGCKFFKTNVLDNTQALPQIDGNVLLSQFLDCFSSEQIVYILKKIHKYSSAETKIYILEPFTDEQKYEIARLSLVHTSLYFTCMANGYSKMYTKKDMVKFVNKAGWQVTETYSSIGVHDYTLLECIKND